MPGGLEGRSKGLGDWGPAGSSTGPGVDTPLPLEKPRTATGVSLTGQWCPWEPGVSVADGDPFLAQGGLLGLGPAQDDVEAQQSTSPRTGQHCP